MTAQALAGALAGLLLAAALLVVLLERRRRALDLDLWSTRGDVSRLELELADARVELGMAGEREDHLRASLQHTTRELEATRQRLEDLALARQRSPLEGELVLVNTPKPDDQTIRGVCRRELRDETGRPVGIVLEAAEYVGTELHRGEERPTRTPIGDVVVPAYAFAQIVQRTEES